MKEQIIHPGKPLEEARGRLIFSLKMIEHEPLDFHLAMNLHSSLTEALDFLAIADDDRAAEPAAADEPLELFFNLEGVH